MTNIWLSLCLFFVGNLSAINTKENSIEYKRPFYDISTEFRKNHEYLEILQYNHMTKKLSGYLIKFNPDWSICAITLTLNMAKAVFKEKELTEENYEEIPYLWFMNDDRF